jgi:hypothetical protein
MASDMVGNGKFEVHGTPDQIRLVRRTLRRCNTDPGEFLSGPLKVKFTNDNMPPRGDNGVAWAFAFLNDRTILINPQLSRYQQKYCFLHEVGHFVDRDHLTHIKRRELMNLMRPEVNDAGNQPNLKWVSGQYRPMPAECFAEYFVGMVSDIRPVNRAFFQRAIHGLPAALEIVKRQKGPGEPPGEDPVDIPENEHPPISDEPADDLAALREEISDLLERLDDLAEQLKEVQAGPVP